MQLKVMINVVKYACRLHSLPEGTLVKAAYTTSVKLDSEVLSENSVLWYETNATKKYS